jgi:transcriptional regulator with XRE-family HTH domain
MALVYNLILFTNILRLLDERRMTKSELANVAGISISFISELTNGKANPSLEVMEQIATALQVSLPELLEVTDLDRNSLAQLAGREVINSLPEGYVRLTAILTEFQAYSVKQWDEQNRKKLASRRVG